MGALLTRRLLFALVLVPLSGGLAWAQGPRCPEFRVNTSTAGHQRLPAVASDAGGNFVVVWGSYPPASPAGIFGQRFSAAGAPRGPEFQVNTYTTGGRGNASVASTATGDFVVTWDSVGDGSGLGVFGRRFDAAGAPQGPEFQVNTGTLFFEYGSSVGVDASGNFVVTWTRWTLVPVGLPPDGIFAQRFDNTGARVGGEFQVETYRDGSQSGPSVAVAANGDFVVVWHNGAFPGERVGISGQRYDSAGVPQGGELPVSPTGFGPHVAFDSAGNFGVVWAGGAPTEVLGRLFDASGAPQGPAFTVSGRSLAGYPSRPRVAFDSSGGFVVVWDQGTDLNPGDVFGRRMGRGGLPEGPVFPVNTYATGNQSWAEVAAILNRGFVVAWDSENQDGSGYGAYASVDCTRLYTVAPCRVADTRNPPGVPLAANSTRTFPVSGICGIPADARAVAFNVTAVNPTDLGDLRLVPAGQTPPNASTLNFTASRTRANNAIVPLGTDGQVSVQCDMPAGSTGTTHLVLDVFGYFKR